MNNFIENYLNKLSHYCVNAELELRILLNKNSINKKDIIFSNFRIGDIDMIKFKESFNRRIKKEPIAKIFNSKSFWKYNFFVNQDVLDPRSETEIIIESVLKYFLDKNKSLTILDMFTGSGCLSISLAKEYPNSKITATDISINALRIAEKNAKILKCNSQIQFINCDILDKIKYYDIVVCNPPYLSELEYSKTSDEIQKFEPKIALVAQKEGYEYFERIANIMPKILDKKSMAFIEIGYSQAQKTIKFFKNNHINCLKIAKDIQNHNRVLILNKS